VEVEALRLLYQPPATPAGERAVRGLARILALITGLKMHAGSLENPVVERGEVAVILSLTRDRLYKRGLEAANRVGAPVLGPIPYWLTALWLRRHVVECGHPGLAYPGLARIRKDEALDLLRIAEALADLTNRKIQILGDPATAGDLDCIIPLTVLPDPSLAEPFKKAGYRVVDASLVGDVPDVVATWILSSL